MRGTGRGARAHYRDGNIATVSADELDPYLRNLDDKEANRIRHLEIDRVGERMGDAAVVDTPGLNALDGFHERVARDFIDESDAVVWIFSATRGGAADSATGAEHQDLGAGREHATRERREGQRPGCAEQETTPREGASVVHGAE